MPLDFQRARPLLQSGNLTKLFVEELGWEPARQKLTLRVGETDYAFAAIAEKRGFTAWSCACANGKLPDHTTRLKLDRALTQTSFEHLIVFPTHDGATQSWMWVRREQGKPLAARTHEFNRSQPGDSLLQKLQHLYISLEDEERGDVHTLTLSDGARAAFDIEKVTKAFYRDFDTHRKAFLKFIEGIGEVADREWYASVMLNRLMFVYFIQRKGFLDGDTNYLRNRLDRCKKEQGKDKFYTFYRYFLLRLFHEGFGKRRKDRAPDLEKLLGSIPYLNGGLFDVHELERPERYGKEIQIDDKAFERVFNYFDQYQWHLDERPLRDDNEINPDVLGYIFEKYINQKQMGAYYTKEDITEYISKNTVIPFLFDAAKAKCKVAFENADGPTIWDLLRENPDRYIYTAVRHGVDKKLPAEIAAGIKDVAKRGGWNKAASAECALPTETWREVVARRQRYEEVRKKLAAGEVRQVNDFITLNLDLRQFAQDVVQNCEGPDLLMAFWQAITEEREVLFPKNEFVVLDSTSSLVEEAIPKICTKIESEILSRLANDNPLARYFTTHSRHVVYYTRKLRYFVQFFDFVPLIKDSKGKKIEPTELKELLLATESNKEVVIAVLNSSLFFWFFCAFSDVRNVNKREILAFRCSLDKIDPTLAGELRSLGGKLMKDFDKNSRMLTGNYGESGVLHIQSFQPRLSKPIIDEIDTVLAKHYGLKQEELDYILNYDAKYRLGRDTDKEEE